MEPVQSNAPPSSSGGVEGAPVVPSTDPQVAVSVPVQSANAKIDEITALQDSIDGLSLAMFEALRGLRDAVAPESGNSASINNAANANNPTNNNNNNSGSDSHNSSSNNTEPHDFEEFWQSYRNNDPAVVAAVHKRNHGHPPQKREDYRRVYALVEREKDAELVARLATTVLGKSAAIDDRVRNLLPGMDRTRQQQLQTIERLMEDNAKVERELQEAYQKATAQRNRVRRVLQEQTCAALGIEEYRD